jgi:hypothetical protein
MKRLAAITVIAGAISLFADSYGPGYMHMGNMNTQKEKEWMEQHRNMPNEPMMYGSYYGMMGPGMMGGRYGMMYGDEWMMNDPEIRQMMMDEMLKLQKQMHRKIMSNPKVIKTMLSNILENPKALEKVLDDNPELKEKLKSAL